MVTTRVVVHVGPMKTGTTAIGAYFSAAHKAGLLPSEVIYPTGDLWFPASGSITKHGQLADYLYPEGRREAGRKTAIQLPDDVAQKVKELAAHAAKGRGSRKTTVFISETLVGRANLGRLVDLLKKSFDEVVFVIAVRSPIEATQSLLVHKIKEWRSDRADLDLYGMLKRANGSVAYDYRRMLTQLHELPIDEFVIIPYFEDESDGYAVIDRFMNIVTGKPAIRLGGDFGSRRIHPSLPLASLKRLASLKKARTKFERVPFVVSILHTLFLRILNADRSKVMRAGFKTRSSISGDWVIPSEERVRILGLYANLGDDLRKALGAQSSQSEWRSWFKATGL